MERGGTRWTALAMKAKGAVTPMTAMLTPYAEKYFEQLPAIWSTRPGMLRIVLGGLLFPYTAASPELLQRADEFLAASDLDPGLARTVIEGRDVAAKALRARALDSDKQQGEKAEAGRRDHQ